MKKPANRYKNVLVTGVSGFIGGYVARYFAGQGCRVSGIDMVKPGPEAASQLEYFSKADLVRPVSAGIIKGCRPEVIIHCAGPASVGLSLENPYLDFTRSVVVTYHMLDAARLYAPGSRFIFISSAAVYGEPRSLPVNEQCPVNPISPYGFHKWQCEQACSEFNKIYGLNTAIVRIFSAYGPGLRRQVIWDICRQIALKKALVLHGTGKESRDFIYISDIAKGIKAVADYGQTDNEVYNLASGREATIKQLAEMIIRTSKLEIEPEFNGKASAGFPNNWKADISKIASLGFKPAIRMEEGLKEFVKWQRKVTHDKQKF